MGNERSDAMMQMMGNPEDIVPLLRTTEEKRVEDHRRFQINEVEDWQSALEPGDTVFWTHPGTNVDCYTVITELPVIKVIDRDDDSEHERQAFRGPAYVNGEICFVTSAWIGLAIASAFTMVDDVKMLSSYGMVGVAAMFKAARGYEPIRLRSDYYAEQRIVADITIDHMFDLAEKYGLGGNG